MYISYKIKKHLLQMHKPETKIMHAKLKQTTPADAREKIQKPQLTFWQIWNMSFGFLGIQFGFALQNANVGRIFQTMGADVDKIGFLMLAAPLTGFLVQPIIGYMSDRTWGRWGRRRPYFFIGAILASLAMIGMPNSSALWVAAGMLWIMDASINISMEPFRAFVGDLLPKEQITKGYAFQTFFIGVGAVVASALPYMLTNWFGVKNTAAAGQIPDSVTYSFYLGALAFFLAVLWTVVKTKEYSPAEMAQYHPEMELASSDKSSSGIAGFFKDYLNMPKTMVQLAVVQFFTWFTWFAMWGYATPAFTQHIYHTTDTTSALYNEGANWWGVCGSVYGGSSAIFAFLLPLIAARTSRKATHAICLAVGGLSFVSIYFISTPMMLVVAFLGVGLAWASTLSMPYAILACTLPANKMGMYMGMFNMFIVIPQIVAGLTLGYFLTHIFDGHAVMMLVLGGTSMLIAATASMFVKEAE
jgi:maltose/moltooligosaccharide transporter